jgi:hypothetical protein
MASGTGNRQRTKQCLVRFTEQEFTEIAGKADRAGIASAAFLRAAALGSPGPRAQRRPPADHKALRQILGHCGRIGNNLNQIAKHLNTGGEANIPELREALTAYLEIRTAILAALAMKTTEAAPDDHQGQQPRQS